MHDDASIPDHSAMTQMADLVKLERVAHAEHEASSNIKASLRSEANWTGRQMSKVKPLFMYRQGACRVLEI